MGTPSINNSWNRGAMRRIRSFPDDERMRMTDAIPRRNRNAIARARSDEWLDVEHTLAVCDALVEVLGAERAVEFWRDFVYESWVGGLLEPLAESLRSGMDEGERSARRSLLELAPAAWSMSARECGEIVVTRAPDGRVQLEARELPPSVRVSQGLRMLYAGALKAMLEFSRTRASVEIVDDADQLAFRVTMKPKT